MPAVLLVSGIGTFVLVGLAGLSVIERYLIVPSLALMIFAAVAIGGWTMLRRGRLRQAWALAALLAIAGGALYTATRVKLPSLTTELRFRGDSHVALVDLLDQRTVRAGLRCGPLSLPNHKLLPDSRWILDLPKDRVLARSDPAARGRLGRGVAVYVTGRTAIFRQAYTQDADSSLIQVPPPGFARRATSRYYAAYVRC
jgi:hypothetical protein